MRHFEFTVTDEYAGERVDKCIAEYYEEFSRSYIQKLIADKLIFVNEKAVKGSYVLKENEHVVFDTPDSLIPDIVPEDIPLDIIYEDDDVLVVNKPKGMVVHPAPGHYSGTLVNGLMHHLLYNKSNIISEASGELSNVSPGGSAVSDGINISSDDMKSPGYTNDSLGGFVDNQGNKYGLSGINGVLRPGIVHRIDMNTTGSLIICKNDRAHLSISEQLKNHSINRIYEAIVHGVIEEDEGTINKPIGRCENDRKKMTVNAKNSKPAITHFKVIKRFEKFTHIECKLETGRTHQIRVHMASIGHPVLGDDVYSTVKSPFKLEGQTLHARTLGFIQPTTGEYIETCAEIPDYFKHLLDII